MAHSLILGGIRSGKSQLAEDLANQQTADVIYLATATAGDAEMSARIQQHQSRRPAAWGLREEPIALGDVLSEYNATAKEPSSQPVEPPCLLIDCMSLWLSNLLHAGEDIFTQQRESFLTALEVYQGSVIIVSNEVGLGIIAMDPLTRRFADELGWLNQSLAQRCDNVVLTVAGLPQVLKGSASL